MIGVIGKKVSNLFVGGLCNTCYGSKASVTALDWYHFDTLMKYFLAESGVLL